MKRSSIAALVVMFAAGCASHLQNSVDSQLTEGVRAALDAERLYAVSATVSGGVATLTGTVESSAERDEAQVATERVEGIRAVANRVKVRGRP